MRNIWCDNIFFSLTFIETTRQFRIDRNCKNLDNWINTLLSGTINVPITVHAKWQAILTIKEDTQHFSTLQYNIFVCWHNNKERTDDSDNAIKREPVIVCYDIYFYPVLLIINILTLLAIDMNRVIKNIYNYHNIINSLSLKQWSTFNSCLSYLYI